MPEKSVSVVSYAVGASLAAAALFYVFAPTHFLDHVGSSSMSSRSPVGLRNDANDCFINSVLQVLAGVAQLRRYLIRETHRRTIEPEIYADVGDPTEAAEPRTSTSSRRTEEDGSGTTGLGRLPRWKRRGLQEGTVSFGLKAMLDALNERPLTRKSIAPTAFIHVLQNAFRQQISRQQQDAQEFLQIVIERLKEEYLAGREARARAYRRRRRRQANGAVPDPDGSLATTTGQGRRSSLSASTPVAHVRQDDNDLGDADEGFPMEGTYESHIECQSCGYRTKPREENFYMLTLSVPQVGATSLEDCLDVLFKSEIIDGYKCDRCRLVHARDSFVSARAQPSASERQRRRASSAIARLEAAIATDPESPPADVQMPDGDQAPCRRIARTTRMSRFPPILVIHLSRSIFSGGDSSGMKNSAKVSFPERLLIGALLDTRSYRLLGLVTHRGSHNSGHYESFRRQNAAAPYYHLNTFAPSGAYSRTASPSRPPSPAVSAARFSTDSTRATGTAEEPGSVQSSLPATGPDGSKLCDPDAESVRRRSLASRVSMSSERRKGGSSERRSGDRDRDRERHRRDKERERRKRKERKDRKARRFERSDRWWRISDEKVKEARTSEALAMQREVYMLFYELESGHGAGVSGPRADGPRHEHEGRG